MYPFLGVLLWILVSSCSQLSRIDGAYDSESSLHIFTDTYAVAVFGGITSSQFGPEYEEASAIVISMFVMLTLVFFIIFMNAMIAFISEEFANMLDYQAAILAKENASIIVDMYCAMSSEERRRIENQCKWVYKLFKQSDLEKTEPTSGDSGDADGRRVMKKDIQSTMKKLTQLKHENSEMRSSLDRIEKENSLIRKGSSDIKSSLQRLEKENGELKATLEKLVIMIAESESSSGSTGTGH